MIAKEAAELTTESIRQLASGLWPERVVPAATPAQAFAEAGLRYEFARQFVVGKDVLDIASGTGIGSSFLKDSGARSVTGADLSSECISLARRLYPACNFMIADGCALPFEDRSFDVVVSFETIEHIRNYSGFIDSCYRILRTPGILVLSTPNRHVSRFTPNPYHVKEFYPNELEEAIGSRFGKTQIFAQTPVNLLKFVPMRAVIGILETLGLKEGFKKALRPKHSELTTDWTFDPARLDQAHRVYDYQCGWVRKPTAILVVANK